MDNWARLANVFRDVFDNDGLQIRREMTAADVEEWDSLTHIDLIVATEREFKIRFTTAEVASLGTVGDLEDLVNRKSIG